MIHLKCLLIFLLYLFASTVIAFSNFLIVMINLLRQLLKLKGLLELKIVKSDPELWHAYRGCCIQNKGGKTEFAETSL